MKKEEYVYQVFENIADGYDAANKRISLGLHMRWKKAAVKRFISAVPQGGQVLDLCCGTGDMTEIVLSLRPDVRVTGLDFSPAMLQIARRRFDGDARAQFMEGDALSLPFPAGRFDAAVISFALRNTADYAAVIRGLARCVKAGGAVCCIDSFLPESRFVRFFYGIYFSRIMPLLGGGRDKREEYRWLCRSTGEFISPTQVQTLMADAGLARCRRGSFMLGACVSLCAYKNKEAMK